jgi:hypothetical protein
MREKLRTSLPFTTMNTPTIRIGVLVRQIQSQLDLVTHPTPNSQHLGWQQLVTPLIQNNLELYHIHRIQCGLI